MCIFMIGTVFGIVLTLAVEHWAFNHLELEEKEDDKRSEPDKGHVDGSV